MRDVISHGISRRLTAVAVCLCVVVAMFGGVGVTRVSAEARLAEPTVSIVAGSRVADPDTMDDYVSRLLTKDTGSRYAGRVWTDKSVFAYGNTGGASTHFNGHKQINLEMETDGYNGSVLFNADFGHVFSALASSQVIYEYPPSPIDLVIAFDMSASMGQDVRFSIDSGSNHAAVHIPDGDEEVWPEAGVPMSDRIANSRLQKTLEAINQTIDALMAQNSQNRVAVVGYGANAVVIMPLGHYRRTDVNGDGTVNDEDPYISVGGMETLYHPSDLVYRTPGDELSGTYGTVDEPGWYWMNNRDTCYTVVVDAQMNTYTGVLNKNTGDGSGRPGAAGDDLWHDVDFTVSNNALTLKGVRVKAFPGAWEHDGKTINDTPLPTFAAQSVEVFQNARDGVEGYLNKEQGNDKLIAAVAGTQAMDADDYVGYFTNTQGGIYLAYKQLADSEATTYTEKLTNGVVSTVARVPAAIIMSDGGANFSFNEMGIPAGVTDAVVRWNSRYGQPADRKNPAEYISDDSWIVHDWKAGQSLNDDPDKTPIAQADRSHRLGGCNGEVEQVGDEWYNVFLPGKDTLYSDWRGLNGIYNIGADIYKDGTLSTAPICYNAGVLYSSDNYALGSSGTILEVLLTAAYMNDVVDKHYAKGWNDDRATEDSRTPLSTYTMNVDSEHVPQWGRMRLYPTLDPKGYPLDDIASTRWDTKKEFGANEDLWASLDITDKWTQNIVNMEGIFEESNSGTPLYKGWTEWKSGADTSLAIHSESFGRPYIKINSIRDGSNITYTSGDEKIEVSRQDIIDNIAYNDAFYDVTTENLSDTFEGIVAEIIGHVFVPISGDNDAGVGDSITYQDPLGQYMEIKNESIQATPYHIDGSAEHQGDLQTYDMALLVFGEMHGLVEAGVYDWHWNDQWMQLYDPSGKGTKPFQMGWYKGTPEQAGDTPLDAAHLHQDSSGSWPSSDPETGKVYNSAQEARDDGWVMRFNLATLLQFVPITGVTDTSVHPSEAPAQIKNTVYTCYRFAGTQQARNALHRNPIYGDVPADILKAWQDAYDNSDPENTGTKSYPVSDSIYSGTPGVYRLSDIRVWGEAYGDYNDDVGAIAPNQGYDRSLYVNIPVAAIPTELATVTLGKDGVMAYQTNLGSDHPSGTVINGKTVTHQQYCYQSTPFRLFYAVGLEDDLILKDANDNQVGVNTSLLSVEYLQDHTDPETGNVWFISNFYSNTTYTDYTTEEVNRTRGDPTVTFSPDIDNRYYVFQKPLPLYAHAYRVNLDGTGAAVDCSLTDFNWNSEAAKGMSNGTTAWENYGGEQQQAATWVGGRFMGVYATEADYHRAFADAVDVDGVKYITDSHGSVYEVVDGGIIFSEEDLLDHVTSKSEAEGGGYTEDSHSFSSDDYYFILLEFYTPTEGTVGHDQDGDVIDGATGGKFVQWALARKGSEFGSGYASSAIKNGDMLCWTDFDGMIEANFAYMSMSDTGDRTRGEPTWEKLTFTDGGGAGKDLRAYLQSIGINDDTQVPNPAYDPSKPEAGVPETIGALTKQLAYWAEMQQDPQVKAALLAADAGGDSDGEVSREEFANYFQFALATRPGGFRSGDMSNNRRQKTTNTTSTAYNYYLPTVSGNSGTDNNVIINNFLGNNGRMEIANETLHVTKLIEALEGYTLTDEQEEDELFNFQVSIQGVTGTHQAVKTEYNEYSKTWERQLAYIDVLADNSDLVLTNSSTRALFVLEDTDSSMDGGKRIPMARQVIKGDDGVWYYAADDGTQSTDRLANQEPDLYYLYLASNGTTDETQHVHRLYQNENYDGEDKDAFSREILVKNGTTTFVDDDHKGDVTPPTEGYTDSYRPEEPGRGRPAGTKTYWTQHAELIPKGEVDLAEGVSDILTGDPGSTAAIATIALEAENSGGHWEHNDDICKDEHEDLIFHTFVIRKPMKETSTTDFTSPYKTRTQYMTVTLRFGQNANETDGSETTPSPLRAEDLYDTNNFGTVTTTARLLQITAEFTLRHGEGLMFSGLSGSDYKFAEKLTDEQIAKGYSLKQITQVQQSGDNTVRDRIWVSGDTGLAEEQVDYVNTFKPGSMSITKKLDAQDGAVLNDTDRSTDFSFNLTITPSTIGAPADGAYPYTVTNERGDTVKTGRLLPHAAPDGLDPPLTANDILANEDGTWDFTLKGGQTMNVEGLPATSGFTYVVKETGLSGAYDVTDSDLDPENKDKTVSGTVEIGGEEPVEVEFTNTKQKPVPATVELPLTKTVTGDGFAWDDEVFSFLLTPADGNPEGDPIEGSKTVMVGKPGDGTDTGKLANVFDGVQFEKAGKFVYTLSEVESGYPGITTDPKEYTLTVEVTEDYGEDPDVPVYSGKLKAELTVEPDEETVAFENIYKEGEISVPLLARKEFNRTLSRGQFSFVLTGVSAEYTEPAAISELSDEPSPKEGEILPIASIPPKPDYEEIPPTVPDPDNTWEQSNTEDGTIDFGKVTFTRPGVYVYTLEEIVGSDLRVKYCASIYRITITIKRAEDGRNLELASIAYMVDADGAGSEHDFEPYDGTALGDVPVFVNEEGTGALEVYKTVTGDGDMNKDFQFTVDFGKADGLEGAEIKKYGADGLPKEESLSIDGEGKLSFTLKHGEHLEVKNLPGGTTYAVTEQDYSDDYNTTIEESDDTPNDGRGTIVVEETDTVRFTNEKASVHPPGGEYGNLVVTKTVTGGGDTEKLFHFTVNFSASSGFGEVTFTKNGEPESLRIEDGKLEFDLKSGDRLEIQNLPGGIEYTVTEQSYSTEGYTTTVHDNDDVATDGHGTIENAQTDEVGFTNHKEEEKATGSLQIEKHVTGAGDTDKNFHFTALFTPVVDGLDSVTITKNGEPIELSIDAGVLYFDLKDGDYLDITGLPSETEFTVTENNYMGEGYVTTVADSDGSLRDGAGTIFDGDADRVVFTNEKLPPPTGSLQIEKQVTGEGDKGKAFRFTVTFEPAVGLEGAVITKNDGPTELKIVGGTLTFDLKDREYVEITGLPVGTTYTVSEADYEPEGYTATVVDNDGDPADGKGTIQSGAPDEVRFTNDKPALPPEKHLGSLTVSKKVTGDAGEKDNDFRFTVTFTPGTDLADAKVTKYGADNRPTGDSLTITAEGKLEFTLRDGERVDITDLPEGVQYTVTEDSYAGDGYTTTVTDAGGHSTESSSATGVIAEGAAAKADFVNDRQPPVEPGRGHLTVTKTVTGTAGDTGRLWRFRVELSEPLTGPYGGMYFADGVASFTLRHGQSVTALNLPQGITYTVTELDADADGYTTRSTNATSLIPDGGTAKAEFVNHKDGETPPPDPHDDTPNTSDNSHLSFWLSLMLTSMAGLLAASTSLFEERRAYARGHGRRAQK